MSHMSGTLGKRTHGFLSAEFHEAREPSWLDRPPRWDDLLCYPLRKKNHRELTDQGLHSSSC
jgi:hypothetical protein